MDFGTLLHMAKKNSEASKSESKFYSTKFAPPKKETKEAKKLSENIQKFLKKREIEEKQRQSDEKQKLANLLAMRDEKSKNKIKKMLKVTKSANKSVLDDAINDDHTAVTLEGPEQPDQDDYGYVSTEANAFYQKYIEKVKDVKEDKGFAPSRPQSLKDLSGTKERVKAAINRDYEEKKNPTRQRIGTSTTSTSDSKSSVAPTSASTSSRSKSLYDPEAERQEEERKKREESQKKAKNRKPPPPPLDFQALLKLAEKKQHEPVEIQVEPKKPKEPERLLTSKEKREMEERKRAKEERERRQRDAKNGVNLKDRGSNKEGNPNGARMEPNGRIPKLSQSTKPSASSTSTYKNNNTTSTTAKPVSAIQGSNYKKTSTSLPSSATVPPKAQNSHSTSTSKPTNNSLKPAASSASKPISSSSTSSSVAKSASTVSKSTKAITTTQSASTASKNPSSTASKNPYNGATREFPPRDIKSIKPRQFPPADVQKTRQFPPSDVRKASNNRYSESKKPQAPKRRLLDEDSEEEYDSELDDFIDDGDCEDDYSSHIKAIFGYDKSKYRYMDEDEDDAAMESNFAQVQREEFISKKIGLQEDLEDMKMEALEKKRKMNAKKRRMHD